MLVHLLEEQEQLQTTTKEQQGSGDGVGPVTNWMDDDGRDWRNLGPGRYANKVTIDP